MNVVSANPTLGQFPDTGIAMDVMYGPEDTAPVFTDPGITYGAGSGAPPISYKGPPTAAPSANALPGFTFPTGTIQSLYPQGVPSAAPRVKTPGYFASLFKPMCGPQGTDPSSFICTTNPLWIVGIGAALLGLTFIRGRRR